MFASFTTVCIKGKGLGADNSAPSICKPEGTEPPNCPWGTIPTHFGSLVLPSPIWTSLLFVCNAAISPAPKLPASNVEIDGLPVYTSAICFMSPSELST